MEIRKNIRLMNECEKEQIILEEIAKLMKIDSESINRNQNLQDELDMNSLDIIDLEVRLEESFGFNINNDNEPGLKTKTVQDFFDAFIKNDKKYQLPPEQENIERSRM